MTGFFTPDHCVSIAPIRRPCYAARPFKGTAMTQTAPAVSFPEVDASKQDCITNDQAQFFRDNGLLVIRKVLRGAELDAMRTETMPLVRKASDEKPNDP